MEVAMCSLFIYGRAPLFKGSMVGLVFCVPIGNHFSTTASRPYMIFSLLVLDI